MRHFASGPPLTTLANEWASQIANAYPMASDGQLPRTSPSGSQATTTTAMLMMPYTATANWAR